MQAAQLARAMDQIDRLKAQKRELERAKAELERELGIAPAEGDGDPGNYYADDQPADDHTDSQRIQSNPVPALATLTSVPVAGLAITPPQQAQELQQAQEKAASLQEDVQRLKTELKDVQAVHEEALQELQKVNIILH